MNFLLELRIFHQGHQGFFFWRVVQFGSVTKQAQCMYIKQLIPKYTTVTPSNPQKVALYEQVSIFSWWVAVSLPWDQHCRACLMDGQHCTERRTATT
jgi:hypothetical protein